jgi:protein-disulfide isomerase
MSTTKTIENKTLGEIYEVVEKALKNSGVEAEVIKVEDFETILNYGVMITPAVVINGEVNSVGKIPDEKEVKKWITE